MMLMGMLIVICSGVQELDPSECLKEMKKYGFSESTEDISKAIDFAFDKENIPLLAAIFTFNLNKFSANYFADQIIRCYLAHPETAFKEQAKEWYFKSLKEAPRILLSKHACRAYQSACEIFSAPTPDQQCITAFRIIPFLSSGSGLSFGDLLAKLALAMPLSLNLFSDSDFRSFAQRQCTTLTPEMAFYICRRYRDEESFQPVRKAFEAQAGPLIVGGKQPSMALEDLLKDLDKGIAEYGRLLCEKYKDVEPIPCAPPPPPEKEIKLKFGPSRAVI